MKFITEAESTAKKTNDAPAAYSSITDVVPPLSSDTHHLSPN